jgi:hypothetical protein
MRHEEAAMGMHVMLRGQAGHVRGIFPEGVLPLLLEEASDVESWSTHYRANSWGAMADRIFAHLESTFGVETVAGRRFNIYLSGQGKPLHQDRNAHSDRAGNITVTASFGAVRCLRVQPLHDGADALVIRQRDGDVFAFTSDMNRSFSHGIGCGRWKEGIFGFVGRCAAAEPHFESRVLKTHGSSRRRRGGVARLTHHSAEQT